MTDAELRALVRDAVARHLSNAGVRPAAPVSSSVAEPPTPRHAAAPGVSAWHGHASHHLYVTLVNTDDACVIEPSVSCDHCGYCKSHGH